MAAHRILVTGGAGFIGSHVADAFLAAGHHVVIVDDLSSGQNHAPGGARLHKIDIRDNRVLGVFRDFEPTALCHHAAQMDVRKSVADPALDADINVVGSLRLLELCRQYGTKQVIFASTGGAIYGEQDVFPASEAHPERPVSPYGCSKLSVEHYLHYYKMEHGLNTCALRYANVYGPRQNSHGEAGVVSIFANEILAGESPTIFGDGNQTRDFVYVQDVVRANLLALEKELTGAFNVGTGTETTVNQIYELLCSELEFANDAVYAPARPGEQRRSCLDASKLAQETGWSVTASVREGLARTAEYFKNLSQKAHSFS